MQLLSVIRDECGTIRRYCKDMSDEEVDELLQKHPEWYRAYEDQANG